MKIVIATSEAIPFAKTGGLADVTGSLLKEFLRLGKEVYLFLPYYKVIRNRFNLAWESGIRHRGAFNPEIKDTGIKIKISLGERTVEGSIFSTDPNVFLIRCSGDSSADRDEFFERDDLYGTASGDFPDNAERFIFFSKAILEALMAMGLKPDIIHCNDWQTGLIPLYLKTIYNNDFFNKTRTVLTIHNIGYQGIFDASRFSLTGLGWEWFNLEGIEFYGRINLLKAGLISSDIITTVSKQYAREILTPDYGHGLDGVLRKRMGDLKGVINGIDIEEWNPSTDRFIPGRFNHDDLSGKGICRSELVRECGLSIEKQAPLISFVGRLSRQKGIDILAESIEKIISIGAGLIILGKGDMEFENMVSTFSNRYKSNVHVRIGYDEAFAHRVYGGSDMFLMPSRYEPCGLGQMIAMRYGTIPVARKTGGIVDTIEDYNPLSDSGTGFLFEDYNPSSLICSIRLAVSLFSCKDRWEGLLRRAMKRDFSWKRSAMEYLNIYDSLLSRDAIGEK